jgi:hypothetical protein
MREYGNLYLRLYLQKKRKTSLANMALSVIVVAAFDALGSVLLFCHNAVM